MASATKVGIEHLKTFLGVIISITNKGVKQFADGVQVQDFFAFLADFMAIPDALKSFQDALAEIKDLDSAERAELNAWIGEQLQLPNADIEQIILNAIDALESGYKLIASIKALPAKEATA